MHRPKIFVSTLPFGEIDHSPREALHHQTGWEILYNPLSAELTPEGDLRYLQKMLMGLLLVQKIYNLSLKQIQT